jgi:hypothetical protein
MWSNFRVNLTAAGRCALLFSSFIYDLKTKLPYVHFDRLGQTVKYSLLPSKVEIPIFKHLFLFLYKPLVFLSETLQFID